MTLWQRYGLRGRMFIFGAIALLPILGLMGYHAWDETDSKIKEGRVAAGNVLARVVVEQELRLALVRQLQAALALNPVIADPKDKGACDRLLQQARASGEFLTGITLYSAAGESGLHGDGSHAADNCRASVFQGSPEEKGIRRQRLSHRRHERQGRAHSCLSRS